MPCLTVERRTELEERLQKKQILLENLYAAMDNFDGVREYRFDSGEGMQQTKYYSIQDIQKNIDIIESQIDRIQKILNGTGLNNVNLRRKSYHDGII